MEPEIPFRIGEFEFDPERQTVSGPEGEVHLEPKPMAVAAHLAARPGRLITRDELIRAVWDDYPGADQSLSNAVSRLRAVTADSAQSPRIIQTVPRRGYRLRAAAAGDARRKGIAVLPLRNLGNDPGDEYLAEGLAEDLINSLSRVSGLRVVARTASFALASRDATIDELAERLDVDYVLEGSVQRSDDQVRIRVRLVEAGSASQVWAEDYRLDWSDLLRIQDAITSSVMDQLHTELGFDLPKSSRQSTRSVHPDAFALYLKGRYFWDRENTNPGKALNYFLKAIELDPDFAAPYAGLVDCYCTYAVWQLMDQDEARIKGLDYAARALNLDPDSPDARFSYGYAQFYFGWNWDEAYRAFHQALERDPEHILATAFLGMLCAVLRRDDEARRLAERLVEIDPVSTWCAYFTSIISYYLRDFERAAWWAKETLELTPGFLPCLWLGGSSLAHLGRVDEAIPIIRELENRCGQADLFRGCAIASYAVCERRGEAERAFTELKRHDGERGVSPLVFSLTLAALGRADEALAALQEAYEEHNATMFYISREPFIDPIRHRPEFRDLLRRLRLPPGFPT